VTHFKSQLGGDLRMLLVLDAPQRLAYRFGNSAGALYRNGRAALKRFTRRADPDGGES